MADEQNIFSAVLVGDTRNHIIEFLDEITKDESDPSTAKCYFGILACACLFESTLEEYTFYWCNTRRNGPDEINGRIMQKLGQDISMTTGLEAWKTWFKVLFNIDVSSIIGEKWKSLFHLFKLRNQLAHGRTTKFPFYYSEEGKFLGMSFEGSGYRRPAEFLIEKKVVIIKDGEIPSFEKFVNKKVVAFFREEVESSIRLLSECQGLADLVSYMSSSGKWPDGTSSLSGGFDID